MEIGLKVRGLSFAGAFAIALFLACGQSWALRIQDSQWEQGKKYLAEGKAKEARQVFESLVKKYPGEPELHLFLGLSSLRLRDAQAAEIHIRRALRLDPDNVEARTLLGWIQLEVRKDYSSAAEEYSRVVGLRPDSAEAHNNLGVALEKEGKLEKAIESFNHALELRANYSEALSNRGWVYARQKKAREARRDFDQALRINPHDEGALYGLSQLLREERDYAGAQKALSSLIAQSPNFVYWLEWVRVGLVRYYWVLLLIAALLFLQGRYRKAVGRSHGS